MESAASALGTSEVSEGWKVLGVRSRVGLGEHKQSAPRAHRLGAQENEEERQAQAPPQPACASVHGVQETSRLYRYKPRCNLYNVFF